MTDPLFIFIAWLIGAIPASEDNLFSPVGIGRILVSAIITGSVAFVFWWWQSSATRRRDKEHKAVAAQLESELRERKELLDRVSASERTLGNFKEQLALMEQAARPLFEAAKIRLIESLTHPSPEFKVPDDLLKLTLGPEGYITPELAKLLKERETSTHPEVTPEEKLAAAILPSVVELAAIEAKVVGPITSHLVSSPAPQPREEKSK